MSQLLDQYNITKSFNDTKNTNDKEQWDKELANDPKVIKLTTSKENNYLISILNDLITDKETKENTLKLF